MRVRTWENGNNLIENNKKLVNKKLKIYENVFKIKKPINELLFETDKIVIEVKTKLWNKKSHYCIKF